MDFIKELFLDIIKFICNVSLTIVIKCLINNIHKTFLKPSIISGFHSHHFLTFPKHGAHNFTTTSVLKRGFIR